MAFPLDEATVPWKDQACAVGGQRLACCTPPRKAPGRILEAPPAPRRRLSWNGLRLLAPHVRVNLGLSGESFLEIDNSDDSFASVKHVWGHKVPAAPMAFEDDSGIGVSLLRILRAFFPENLAYFAVVADGERLMAEETLFSSAAVLDVVLLPMRDDVVLLPTRDDVVGRSRRG